MTVYYNLSQFKFKHVHTKQVKSNEITNVLSSHSLLDIQTVYHEYCNTLDFNESICMNHHNTTRVIHSSFLGINILIWSCLLQ